MSNAYFEQSNYATNQGKKKSSKVVTILLTVLITLLVTVTVQLVIYKAYQYFSLSHNEDKAIIDKVHAENWSMADLREFAKLEDKTKNEYETISQLAEAEGVDLDTFKKQHGLPDDMPGDTIAPLAFYNKYNLNLEGYGETLDLYARYMGKSLDEIKEELGLPEDMTGSTLYAIANVYTPLSKFAESNDITVEEIKKLYGLEDDTEITGDTPIGVVSKKNLEKEIAEKEEAKEEEAVAEEASAEEEAATEEAEAE